jgi:hypothetical protein
VVTPLGTPDKAPLIQVRPFIGTWTLLGGTWAEGSGDALLGHDQEGEDTPVEKGGDDYLGKLNQVGWAGGA